MAGESGHVLTAFTEEAALAGPGRASIGGTTGATACPAAAIKAAASTAGVSTRFTPAFGVCD